MSEGRIALCEPQLSGNVRRYLDECLASGFVSSVGPFVERFERAFAAQVGARFAVACASGTAALHVACRLAGVRPGDEVFVSTLTFIASANPICYQGGTPVLVDAERTSLNLDTKLVIAELERRARADEKQPKAIIAVHILGLPADLSDLVHACHEHGVVLIEDAAEALGASFTGGGIAGRQVGTVGDFGCFSFNGNKIITTGGGGMLTTDDEGLARRAKHLTTQARLPGPEYRHDEVGYNYRLTNLSAALGLAQLEELGSFLAKKRAISDRYNQAFRGQSGLGITNDPPWGRGTGWLYPLAIGGQNTRGRSVIDRQGLMERLGALGIESRPIWTPLHLQTPHAGAPRLGGKVAEAIFASTLCLPSSVGLTAAEQERVITAVLGATQGR